MSTKPIIEIRNIRIDKVAALRALGLNPYTSRSTRTHYAQPILDDYASHENQVVTVAGRLMSWRKQGGLAFGHMQDQTGKIQVFIQRQFLQATDGAKGNLGFADLHLLDLGDIVEATGAVIKTNRGEISVRAESLRVLTKAIRPLPDQWAGLKDREQVVRKRYLDAVMNRQTFDRFKIITQIAAAIRGFLNQRGFLEFNTPIIQPQYGGGTAKPFKTHVNALSCEMYLAISHELYLKRLIAAGYERVYTIGRYFRNEGIDRSHHPEFSMVETMTAYENYEFNMGLVEEMFRHVAQEVFGRQTFTVGGHVVDFGPVWPRIRMTDAILAKTGIDFCACTSVDEANRQLARIGLFAPQPSIGEAIARAFEAKVERDLVQPTIIFGHPVEISPLAKPMAHDPRFAERFEVFIGGMECGDNWSEQNDPVQLLQRWKQNYRVEERDSGKFHALDLDFIEALEYGIPPTTGIGPGLERMAMIFTEQNHIDDVIFFPLTRPQTQPINAEIYGISAAEAPLPVEDLVLTFDDFESLCDDGVLKPHARHLVIRPQVRLWRVHSPMGRARASGQVEVEGFIPDGVLRLAGYKAVSQTSLEIQDEPKQLLDLLEVSFLSYLRETFPECELTVEPVSIVSDL